jgi:hypothetical protein
VTGTARLDRFRRDSGLRVPPVGRQWGRQANVSNGSETSQTVLAAGREKYHQAKGQVCAKRRPSRRLPENLPGATMVALTRGRSGRSSVGVSLGISRSAGRLFSVIKLQSLLVFDGRNCYFLIVVFGGVSIARCRTILKTEIQQRNPRKALKCTGKPAKIACVRQVMLETHRCKLLSPRFKPRSGHDGPWGGRDATNCGVAQKAGHVRVRPALC